MTQSETTTLNIRALDTPIRLRAMANNMERAIPELTAISRGLLHEFVDAVTQSVAEYRDINPRAITISRLRNGKIHRNGSKKQLGIARVITRQMVDAGLKEIARKETEAAAAEEAKLVRKQQATARKTAQEQAIQQKKAAREAQAVLEAQWNADYAAAEAVWRIERDQARAEHRKPPKKPVKPPKPRAVYSVVSVEGVEGGEDIGAVEGVNNAEIAEVAEVAEDEDAEELADMVRELEIIDFRNVSAGK